MAEDKINVPAGFGGLMRYSDEFESKIKLRPVHVVAFVILIVIFRVALGFFLK